MTWIGSATTSLRGKIIAWTSALTVLLGFVVAVEAFFGKISSLTCATGMSLPWCQAPVFAETWSDEVGGPGGNPFSKLACRDGDALVGLFGKADRRPFLFSIGPICAAAQFSRKHQLTYLSPTVRKGDGIGSNQGEPFDLVCPANMVVVGYEFDSSIVNTLFAGKAEYHEYLAVPMSLRCSNVLATDASSRSTVTQTGEHQGNASRKPFLCPDGNVAFAIKGRAGQFIDAISLGCRRS